MTVTRTSARQGFRGSGIPVVICLVFATSRALSATAERGWGPFDLIDNLRLERSPESDQRTREFAGWDRLLNKTFEAFVAPSYDADIMLQVTNETFQAAIAYAYPRISADAEILLHAIEEEARNYTKQIGIIHSNNLRVQEYMDQRGHARQHKHDHDISLDAGIIVFVATAIVFIFIFVIAIPIITIGFIVTVLGKVLSAWPYLLLAAACIVALRIFTPRIPLARNP